MMTVSAGVLQLAVPFVWLGMVLAISGMETPLKFRAPGMTRALGLGVGRLVFRALNGTEIFLATVLTITLIAIPVAAASATLVVALWVVLLVQVFALRPSLDRRAQVIMQGGAPPRSPLHLLYIGLEALKVFGLAALGILLGISVLV